MHPGRSTFRKSVTAYELCWRNSESYIFYDVRDKVIAVYPKQYTIIENVERDEAQ